MKKKILLVDDEMLFANAIIRILEHANYTVIYASNGQEALQVVMGNMPDLIFCDVNMPLSDGHEFCAEFRKLPNASTIPFIFLTSNGTPDDIRSGMKLGADDYLKKPCSRKEILEAVTTRLKRKQDIDLEVANVVGKYATDLQVRDNTLGQIAQNQSHVVRAPLAALMQVVSMIDLNELNENNRQLIRLLGGLATQLDTVIRENVYGINTVAK